MSMPHIDNLLRQALQEDAAYEDLTSQALIGKSVKAEAQFVAKQDLVLCGLPLLKRLCEIFDNKLLVESRHQEGASLRRHDKIAKISGLARSILAVERVALNFMQRLSGIATLTHKFVEQTKGTETKILDTRKTTPGLRELERYAVRTGGGVNHRFDLKSAIMVKDNHRALSGSFSEILAKLKPYQDKIPIIVEVESLKELEEAFEAGATYIQLDNMGVDTLRKAVQWAAGRCRLEATGGITLTNIRAVAKTGVDFVSIGALTHSAPAVDISLEM